MSHEPTGFQSNQYEFNSEQNRTISGLADAMSVVATLMQVLGLIFVIFCGLQLTVALQAQGGYGPAIGLGVPALLFLAFGFWTSSSAKSFRRIVESQNEDIWHLMNALGKLHSLYSVLRTLIMGGLVLAIVGIALAVVTMVQK